LASHRWRNHALFDHESNSRDILIADDLRPASIIRIVYQRIKSAAGQDLKALIKGKGRRPTEVGVSARIELVATALYWP
jgi:hypothetical protein